MYWNIVTDTDNCTIWRGYPTPDESDARLGQRDEMLDKRSPNRAVEVIQSVACYSRVVLRQSGKSVSIVAQKNHQTDAAIDGPVQQFNGETADAKPYDPETGEYLEATG